MLHTTTTWKKLLQYKETLAAQSLLDLFNTDPNRARTFSLQAAGIFLDYSKNRVTYEVLEQLLELTEQTQLPKKIEILFSGLNVNTTEQRPAIHTALREPLQSAKPEIKNVREQIKTFCKAIDAGQLKGYSGAAFTDIVNIGIGGSDLGPKLACDALKPYQKNNLRVHFISNIDDYPLNQLLKTLNADTTLFIIVSKSFNTIETSLNMHTAKEWLEQATTRPDIWQRHFIAVTANIAKAKKAGFKEASIFPFWDGVGGRYSLWSAVGLAIALCIGAENFEAMLGGAHAMDLHFKNNAFNENMPVILALLEIWHSNFCLAQTHAIIPYNEKLRLLPSYLQQLVMESNGKSVNDQGKVLPYSTSPIVWGEVGTNCQHSFMQLLHQSKHLIPVDFIAVLRSEGRVDPHQQLLANCFSQANVLMIGKDFETAKKELQSAGFTEAEAKRLASHQVLPGNRPSNMLLLKELTPASLGALIALYEHKVFTTAVIWGINPFDQWGVEMGKRVATELHPKFQSLEDDSAYDSSTRQLLALYRDAHEKS